MGVMSIDVMLRRLDNTVIWWELRKSGPIKQFLTVRERDKKDRETERTSW